MIEELSGLPAGVIGFEASGRIRAEDYRDVVLPARSASGPARLVRLRCVTEPDAAQKVLLGRLGVKLPRRLRRLDEVSQM